MKIQLVKNEFVNALNDIIKVVPAKPLNPVFAGVYISISKQGQLLLKATDSSSFITRKSVVESDGDAEFIVGAKEITEIVKSFSIDKIEIQDNDNSIKIIGGKTQFTIPKLPIDNFPTFPSIDKVDFTVNTKDFSSAINAVESATDDKNPTFTNIQLKLDGDSVFAYGTDRFRIAKSKFNILNNQIKDQKSILVKAKSLFIATRAFEELNTINVSLNYDADEVKQISFASDTMTLTLMTSKGEFPDFTTIIGEEFSESIIVHKEDVLAALKQVSIVFSASSLTAGSLKHTNFKITKNTLDISVSGEESATAEVEAEYAGADIQVIFNNEFIIDGIENVNTKFVKITFNPDAKKFKINEIDNPKAAASDSYTYILMPILN